MNKIKLVIFVFVFIIIFCVVGSFFIQADTEILMKEDILATQNDIMNDIEIYGYTFDNPNIIVNPYKTNYNCALITFETSDYVSINVNVNDEDIYTSKKDNKHYIGVYDLNVGNNIILLSYGKKKKVIEISIEEGNTINWEEAILISDNHLLVPTYEYMHNKLYTGIREIDALGKIYYEYLLEYGYKGIACEIDKAILALLSKDLIILDRQNGKVIKSIDISSYKFNWFAMEYADSEIILYSDNITISVDLEGNITEIDKIYEKQYLSGDINYKNTEGIRFYEEIKTILADDNIWLLNYSKDININYEIIKEFNRIIVKSDDINDCNNYLILDKFLDKRVYALCDKSNYIYTYDFNGKYSIYFKVNDEIYKTDYYLNF